MRTVVSRTMPTMENHSKCKISFSVKRCKFNDDCFCNSFGMLHFETQTICNGIIEIPFRHSGPFVLRAADIKAQRKQIKA